VKTISSRQKNLLISIAALLVLFLMAYFVYQAVSGKPAAKPRAPKISLIPTTPPPPPPPPKEEKRPEPPKEQKEVKVDQATPPKDAPPAPATPDLKMDGPAGDGPSAFSAGKITREDLSNIGKGVGSGPSSGMFNPFNNYATALKGELQRYLARNKELLQRPYRVEVQLWVGQGGKITRHEVIGSSGSSETDELIRQALAKLGTFSQGPPERMPQPIRLRVATGNTE
jgi:periplasmic protein TonB